MHQEIYLLKLELLSERFEMDQEELRTVNRMANFIALFQAYFYLRSRLSTYAPQDDLNYLKQMIKYKEEDRIVAAAALKSIKNHLWYLTEEGVVLAIFNEEIDENTRWLMVQRLLSFNRPASFMPGKPKMPKVNDNNVQHLFDLIGSRSWLLFDLLGLQDCDLEWMRLRPQDWPILSSYRKTRDFVKSLEVTNDCAERGVKLIEDFKDMV